MIRWRAIIIIMLSAVCTLFWRVLPFTLLRNYKKIPTKVAYLGRVLPPALMAVLIVYCLKDVPFQFQATGIWKIAGVVVTAISYLWKKNTLLSIVLGTGSYMLLLHLF